MNRFAKITGAFAVAVSTGLFLSGCSSWNVKSTPENQQGTSIREPSGAESSMNWSNAMNPVRTAEPHVMAETNGWLRGYGNKISEPAGAEAQTSHMRQLPKSQQPAPPSSGETKSSSEDSKSSEP